MERENLAPCMECHELVERDALINIHDNYGIFFKSVCEKCHDKVERQIRSNHYGDELTHDELYGEDD